MLKISTGLFDWGKDWDTGLAVDNSQSDVIEAFVKPRSRPEPNLGSGF